MLVPRTWTSGHTSPLTDPLVHMAALLAGRSALDTGMLVVEFYGPL